MKKITLLLFIILSTIAASYGQVSYQYGWEPTGLGSWTSANFSRTTSLPCGGVASIRANTYSSPNVLTSPLLGQSNGGVVTFNFDYKVITWDDTSVPAPSNQVDILAEWSSSASGPWFPIGSIGEANHVVSTTCALMSFNFSPTPGNLYVRFICTAVNGADVYNYFDNINVTQGAAPSCVSPTGIVASNVTSNSATISWTESTSTPSAGYQYYFSDVNEAPTVSGTSVPTGLTVNLTPLSENTNYYVWVRSMCGTDASVWNGPMVFRTLCTSFTVPFLENFNSDSATESCWKVLDVNGDGDLWDLNYASTTIEGDQSAILYTDYNVGANDDWLISPKITLTGAEQLSFKYKTQSANEPNDFRVVLSTTGNTPADFTNVLMPLTQVANTESLKKVVSLAGYTGDVFIAWHVPSGGLDGWRLYIDEVAVEPIPSSPPACIDNMNVVPNNTCGNFATTFTWTAVPGADFYKVSIGTSPLGQDLIVSDVNIGNVLTYSFVGNANTTYYYTIKAANTFGSAINCFEDSFDTEENQCYCGSVPTSNDGSGVSNVQINDFVTAVTDVTYADFTSDGAVDITQGVNTVVNVTLATAFAYFTNVWVDFNDNYVFEPSELVFESLTEIGATNPTVVNTSFMTPLTAGLGEHRLRIVTTDIKQTPANPCYNGSYGVTLDFTVNVLPAPACLPPTATSVSNITAATAQINWVSSGTTFNVERVFAGDPQGSGITTSGITGNTTILSGLDAQMDYAYYIQTDCGSGSVSPWTGPFNFRTACDAFGDFTEDFTTDVTFLAPECWYTIKNATNSFAYVNVSSFSDYVTFYNSDDINANLYLITPSLTALPLGTHRVKFKANGPAGSSMIVGTMSDPTNAATFVPKQTITLTSTFTDYSVTFLDATTANHVAFKSQATGTYQYVYLDDVVWETAPSCSDLLITSFVASNNALNSVTLTWVDGSPAPANGYQYYYTEDFSETPDANTVASGSVVAGISTANLTGLAASSTYKFYLRGVCSASDFSIWVEAGTFSTLCETAPLPYTIDFENAIVPNLPLCTTIQNAGNGNNWKTANPGSPFTTKVLNYSYNFAEPANAWFFTNRMSLVAGTTYSVSYEFGNDGFYSEKMKVAYGTAANATAMTTELANHPLIELGIVEENTVTFTPAVSGDYVIGFNAYSDEDENQLYLDNIVIDVALSSGSFDKNTFTAYPNPVKDMLNLSFTQNISEVTVYNLLGQQVLFTKMNSNKGQVDMSNLSSGSYLVKVNTENAAKTIKVIKQ